MKKEIKKRVRFIYSFNIAVCLLSLSLWSVVFAATYNSATGELRLPSVFDGENTYTDAVLILHAGGTYSFAGNIEALPLLCGNDFSEETLNLINKDMSISDINTALGCQWHQRYTHSNLPEDKTYIWIDNQCTTVQISSYKILEEVNFSKSIGLERRCEQFSHNGKVYDLTAERFIIPTVIIDNAQVAHNTILKFNAANKTWELISIEINNLQSPSQFCGLFAENVLTAMNLQLTSTMTEFESTLGCHWSHKSSNFFGSSDIAEADPYFEYGDHECNSMGLIVDQESGSFDSITFIYSKTGCS